MTLPCCNLNAMANGTRRQALLRGASAVGWLLVLPSLAHGEDLDAAIRHFTGGKPVSTGKVVLDISPLVDNGNAVPVTVSVRNAMRVHDHVRAIAIFNERNPQREVANFTLGTRTGRATVSTRIRLATSQKLVALAELSDGSFWQHQVDVIVTLAACVEGDT